MRNSSSLDWLRFMHTPNDYRVSQINHYTLIIPKKRGSFTLSVTPSFLDKLVWCD